MFRFLLKRKRKVASPIINASWCLGGVILRLLSKRIESGKGTEVDDLREDGRNTSLSGVHSR